ncbi:Terminal organelle assembly protein [Parasponia andersonii]|uniref:Terminal organelle assembly protein n=1 Tax=Parasponia andersonii TaxID=3476 RepID=A0A2P5C235_PARAD|nr:Terminal organelle assembly protein [Parasponia andersonii]
MATTTSSSLYEILGISISASGREIKAAYRKLARTCHPDVVAFEQKDASANEFMKIHTAYSTLSDPDKRANYDRSLFNRRKPFGYSASAAASASASAMAGFSYSSCRSWETDQCW